MYNEHNSLANRWRYTIGRDTKIRSHLQPVHFRNIEDRSINAGHYDRFKPFKSRNRSHHIIVNQPVNILE